MQPAQLVLLQQSAQGLIETFRLCVLPCGYSSSVLRSVLQCARLHLVLLPVRLGGLPGGEYYVFELYGFRLEPNAGNEWILRPCHLEGNDFCRTDGVAQQRRSISSHFRLLLWEELQDLRVRHLLQALTLKNISAHRSEAVQVPPREPLLESF